METSFVVIGGGIAGVTCAEVLAQMNTDEKVLLVSESPLIKSVTNCSFVTELLTEFEVKENSFTFLTSNFKNVTVVHDSLVHINSRNHEAILKNIGTVKYKMMCLCTGADPNLIPQAKNCEYVLGIRDTDSVEVFIEKLKQAKRVAIIGNGGIASELVFKIDGVEVVWIIKDKHITSTFIDPGAATFFQSVLDKTNKREPETIKTRMRYEMDSKGTGVALGPDWYKAYTITGANLLPASVQVRYDSKITNLVVNKSAEHPVVVTINGCEEIPCDLVVSATGVTARINYTLDEPLIRKDNGDILVNDQMQTNLPSIFAAGDVCHPNWEYAKHWFPMKLWTQARQMGSYAAKCMLAKFNSEPDVPLDFCFEIFEHATNLFGYKVALLGLYNGQKLGTGYECIIRMTKDEEYIKFVMENDRLQGALLIGDVSLAETCENLILNQLDLKVYGEDILNPNVDIEDYFD